MTNETSPFYERIRQDFHGHRFGNPREVISHIATMNTIVAGILPTHALGQTTYENCLISMVIALAEQNDALMKVAIKATQFSPPIPMTINGVTYVPKEKL